MYSIFTLTELQQIATLKYKENERFVEYIKKRYKNADFDALTHSVSTEIMAQINCLECANCCKSLEPEISSKEAESLAQAKTMTVEAFKKQYTLEDNSKNLCFMTANPCLFLNEKACSIYQQRPASCADFPHLHHPNTKYRLKRILENYKICPIIYHTIEILKEKTNFFEPY